MPTIDSYIVICSFGQSHISRFNLKAFCFLKISMTSVIGKVSLAPDQVFVIYFFVIVSRKPYKVKSVC